ncbi:CaiB/BaiF CoA transferase family protein [Chloroflexota bacterium]
MKIGGPMIGIRVLDLTWVVMGPQATRLLADAGAEVIKVEYGGVLDSLRQNNPVPGEKSSPNRSPFHNHFNRNKLGITLNIWHPEGMKLLKRLISVSDVIIENFGSRVMERWGLSYAALTEIKPDIIYVSMSGFGHSGRHRDYVTWGQTAQALSGVTYMSGLPGKPPAGWGYSYLDYTPGCYGAIAILVALHHRHCTGEGQLIDVSQVECGITLCGPTILDYAVNGRSYRRAGNPPGNRLVHPATAPHGIYRCAGDDCWCAISIFTEKEWHALCKVMGNPEWAEDAKFDRRLARIENQDELDSLIEEWTSHYTPYEVMHQLQSVGIAAGVVQSPRDRLEHDPQLAERGMFLEVDHPELGLGKVDGFTYRLSRTPLGISRASPLLGEHNEYVYGELLGMTKEEIQQLAKEGAI